MESYTVIGGDGKERFYLQVTREEREAYLANWRKEGFYQVEYKNPATGVVSWRLERRAY